jgi:hypothetical protein
MLQLSTTMRSLMEASPRQKAFHAETFLLFRPILGRSVQRAGGTIG